MTTITTEQVLDALKQAVAERGAGFHYNDHYNKDPDSQQSGCQYVEVTEEGAEPACIAGNALFKLGVPIDALMSMDKASSGGTSTTVSSASAHQILRSHGISISNDAVSTLHQAQSTQDSRRSWGEALEEAERYARSYA